MNQTEEMKRQTDAKPLRCPAKTPNRDPSTKISNPSQTSTKEVDSSQVSSNPPKKCIKPNNPPQVSHQSKFEKKKQNVSKQIQVPEISDQHENKMDNDQLYENKTHATSSGNRTLLIGTSIFKLISKRGLQENVDISINRGATISRIRKVICNVDMKLYDCIVIPMLEAMM